jgi:hypothetical protein
MPPLASPDAPPACPARHASVASLDDVASAAYWRALCPSLHVGDDTYDDACAPLRCATRLRDRARAASARAEARTHALRHRAAHAHPQPRARTFIPRRATPRRRP